MIGDWNGEDKTPQEILDDLVALTAAIREVSRVGPWGRGPVCGHDWEYWTQIICGQVENWRECQICGLVQVEVEPRSDTWEDVD